MTLVRNSFCHCS